MTPKTRPEAVLEGSRQYTYACTWVCKFRLMQSRLLDLVSRILGIESDGPISLTGKRGGLSLFSGSPPSGSPGASNGPLTRREKKTGQERGGRLVTLRPPSSKRGRRGEGPPFSATAIHYISFTNWGKTPLRGSGVWRAKNVSRAEHLSLRL